MPSPPPAPKPRKLSDSYEWRTPATAEAADRETLEPFDFRGFVCVRPSGEPWWGSARSTAEESMQACFGHADRSRLDTLAREGWRCIPIAPSPEASPA